MIGKTIEAMAKQIARESRMKILHRQLAIEKKAPIHRTIDAAALRDFQEYHFGGAYSQLLIALGEEQDAIHQETQQ